MLHNNPGAANLPKPLVVLQKFRQPLTRSFLPLRLVGWGIVDELSVGS
ncbi:hypothetical protein I8751_21635 [Nostocaceae cyanobacterium CENA357]|uniref:Uncharacterized protein n=1 Tax=Atlanticothrix silvestris CENA357 TaxID=1725252 RepID=A0A8J7L7A6_9CYAN|nr:hypothetical protein [Atlanticothrix silvestris]MBH8554902.1 hypothetical protein [Atlanticothrix silvestris CENA357]